MVLKGGGGGGGGGSWKSWLPPRLSGRRIHLAAVHQCRDSVDSRALIRSYYEFTFFLKSSVNSIRKVSVQYLIARAKILSLNKAVCI